LHLVHAVLSAVFLRNLATLLRTSDHARFWLCWRCWRYFWSV